MKLEMQETDRSRQRLHLLATRVRKLLRNRKQLIKIFKLVEKFEQIVSIAKLAKKSKYREKFDKKQLDDIVF